MVVPTLALLPHLPAAEATHLPALGPPAAVVAHHTVGPGLRQIVPDPGLSLAHRPSAAEHVHTREAPVAVAVAAAVAAHTGLVALSPGLSHRQTRAVPRGTAATPDQSPDLSPPHVAAKALAEETEAIRGQFLDLHRLLVADATLQLLFPLLLNAGQSHGVGATLGHHLAVDKPAVVM